MLKKIFNTKNYKKTILILFVLIALMGVLFYIYYQRGIYGQDRVRFDIHAPENVSAGEKVDYIVRYKNNSDYRLEEVVLHFEYPEYSLPIEPERDVDKEDEENEIEETEKEVIVRDKYRREVRVGELNPGEEKTTTFSAVLIGKEGTSFESSAEIRYVPRNITRSFRIPREHIAIIDDVPIAFDLQVPSTMDPNRESSFRMRFSSEVDYPLSDISLKVNYPSGFRFVRSKSNRETSLEEENRWEWPVLNRGDDIIVDVDGVLNIRPGESGIFNASLGVYVNDNFVILKEASRGVQVAESDLLLDIIVSDDGDYVANPGELIKYDVIYRNIGNETLEELSLDVYLNENSFDFEQVDPGDGRFQKERGIITWSHLSHYDFESLGRGEDGKVTFWARVKNDLPYNPEATVRAKMDRAEKEIVTMINTRLEVAQNILRENSPFGEMGTFPFLEGEKANYAVKWELKNYFSNARDTVIRATLPEGAKITGKKEPKEEFSLSFNSSSREVVVDLGVIGSGTTREVYFEVEIDPKKDFDLEDELISNARAAAQDIRTNRTVSYTASPVLLGDIYDGPIEEKEEEEEENKEE